MPSIVNCARQHGDEAATKPMTPLADVRVILFDAVGTLIFPHPAVSEVYARIGQRFGSQRSPGEIKTRFATALTKVRFASEPVNEAIEYQRWQAIVAEVLDDAHDPDGQMFNGLWRHFSQPEHWALFDDVAPAWNSLANSQRILGIASNFDARLRAVCAGWPPLNKCESLFISSEIGFAKPDKRYFEKVTHHLGVEPASILLIGDDVEADYEGALAAGWNAILLDRSGRRQGSFVIPDLHALTLRLASP